MQSLLQIHALCSYRYRCLNFTNISNLSARISTGLLSPTAVVENKFLIVRLHELF